MKKAKSKKCKRCSYLYGLLQQIREFTCMTKSDLLIEKRKKTPTLFTNDKINHFLFRLDYIEDFCLDADKEDDK